MPRLYLQKEIRIQTQKVNTFYGINFLAAILREKEPGTGIYQFMINPGTYMLSVSRMGFCERSEEILACQGENDFRIEMRPASGQPANREGQRTPLQKRVPKKDDKSETPENLSSYQQENLMASDIVQKEEQDDPKKERKKSGKPN